MGIRHAWTDDRQMIMNVYLEFPWTWKEYQALVDTLMPVMRDLNHPCAIAVDVRNMGTIPRDGHFLTMLMSVEKKMPENVFASVIIGTPYALTVFMNMLIKLRPRVKRIMLFAATPEEAHAKIQARYQELYSNPRN